jgi:sugar/nucleoside kinase (ribokinase family)
MQAEGIQQQFSLSSPTPLTPRLATILCFVLKNGATGEHAFCSQYDMGPWPLLQPHVPETMHPHTLEALRGAQVVMVNGCLFDEVPVGVAVGLAREAQATGSAVFFDPGPRSQSLASPSRSKALQAALAATTVVLMTQEEAGHITGTAEPRRACKRLLRGQYPNLQWVIVKRGAAGAVLGRRDSRTGEVHFEELQGFAVRVADTLGCGDAFAAAVRS